MRCRQPSSCPTPLWRCRGRKIALDVARGLHYLHSNSVIHFECAPPLNTSTLGQAVRAAAEWGACIPRATVQPAAAHSAAWA